MSNKSEKITTLPGNPPGHSKESKIFDPAKEFLGLSNEILAPNQQDHVDYFEIFCQENTIDIYKWVVKEHMKKTYGA